jgi:Sigma-54, DNA binding domain
MEIAHQLPGRVRVRIPGLASEVYCRELVEKLSNDDRISEQRISASCNSLIVSYDPLRIQTEDILSLLSGKKPSKPKKSRKSRKSKAGKAKAAKKVSTPPKGRKAKAKAKKTAAAEYFKPAISSDVQERIRMIISAEDPQKPCSDGKISELLKTETIDIARRTVAKYREMMGIPSSNKRRKKDAS